MTDTAIRKNLPDHLTRQWNGVDMPSFITKSRDREVLPGVID
jgi:hypothetical protein